MNNSNLLMKVLEAGSSRSGASVERSGEGLLLGCRLLTFHCVLPRQRTEGSHLPHDSQKCTSPIHEAPTLVTSLNPKHLPPLWCVGFQHMNFRGYTNTEAMTSNIAFIHSFSHLIDFNLGPPLCPALFFRSYINSYSIAFQIKSHMTPHYIKQIEEVFHKSRCMP